MRLVEWQQGNRKRRSWVKDSDPDEMAQYGIPAEVPDLDGVDWEGVKNEIRAALEAQGLFSWLDVERSQVGFAPALTIVKRALVRLYREAQQGG